jgi:hypothetical protein
LPSLVTNVKGLLAYSYVSLNEVGLCSERYVLKDFTMECTYSITRWKDLRDHGCMHGPLVTEMPHGTSLTICLSSLEKCLLWTFCGF